MSSNERLVVKILIVDDDMAMRALICRCVADLEAQLLEAENGTEAIALALRERPDLILLDNMMPGSRGVDVAAALRKDEGLDETTIVIVSSDPEPDVRDRMSLPYNGWICKPFNPLTFAEDVSRIVANKRWTPRPIHLKPPPEKP